MNKQELLAVYNDTKAYFENVEAEQSFKYNYDEINVNVETLNNQETIIEVLNIDSFDLAINYVNDGLNPMVLNMASDICPGHIPLSQFLEIINIMY